MLKAWNFTKHKLHHRGFDNNLQKHFQTNILENDTTETVLIVVFDGRLTFRELTDLHFKMIPSSLAAREISRLEF